MQVHRARTLLAVTVAIFVTLPRVGFAAPDDKKRAEREALKASLLQVLQRDRHRAVPVERDVPTGSIDVSALRAVVAAGAVRD